MNSARDEILVPRLQEQLETGRMDRRSFVRFAALLGIGVGAAYAMADAIQPATASEPSPFPPPDAAAKKGGTIRIGQMVSKMEDPATYSWTEMSNQSRPIVEYMTMVGPDNVVRPMLLDGWEPSADLKTWTLHVRKGVMWHNGEDLTADHLAWNIGRWTDSATGSSNLGLSTFSALAQDTGEKDTKGKTVRKSAKGGVEVVDSNTLRLHLSAPVLSVAEDFAEYPTAIVHPSFKAPFSDKPIGTGPYALSELKVGDRCILTRVTKTSDGRDFKYWGGDVYLDQIHFYHYEQDNQAAALASGSVDAIYELTVEQLELAKSIEGAQILSCASALTLCLRMQLDAKPFDDIRVRKAVVKAADNTALQALVFPEGGLPAFNFHVAPIHPAYYPLPSLARDVAGAKQLLKEAGYPDGLSLTIDCGNTDGAWHQATCEALKDQLKDAGIQLTVNVMPTAKFWEVWDKTPFGATSWGHRPLDTMVLAQAYRTGVPWNETHFSDPAFDAALADAEATLDVDKRKAKMQKVETILQDAAVMIQPFWVPLYRAASSKVHGCVAHPARHLQLTKVWMS